MKDKGLIKRFKEKVSCYSNPQEVKAVEGTAVTQWSRTLGLSGSLLWAAAPLILSHRCTPSAVISAAFCLYVTHMTEGKWYWNRMRFFLLDWLIFAFHDTPLKKKQRQKPLALLFNSLPFLCAIIYRALVAFDGFILMKISTDEQWGQKKMIELIFRNIIAG